MKQSIKYLKILLWLIAFHSFTVALFLIFLGDEGISIFGFESGNRFFQVQGGVFHIVMCLAYILASFNTRKNSGLIIFIIGAKSIATVYLLLYYFFCSPVITILLSGLADGLMAMAVWFLWKHIPDETEKETIHG